MPDFKRIIREVHRRSLWQVLGVYVVTGWVILQFVDTLAGALNLPEWASPLALFLLIIGLPVVLATAFIQSSSSGEVVRGATPRAPDAEDGYAALRTRFTWRRALAGGGVAFAILLAVAVTSVVVGGDDDPDATPEVVGAADPAVAVLPFTVRGPGAETWSEGLVDALSPMIDGVAGIRAINSRTVLARWHEATDGVADLERSLAVAREAGATFALVGSAVASGSTTRLELELFDGGSGERLDRSRVEGPTDDLLRLTDQAAAEAVRLVLGALGRIPDIELDVLTASATALTAFLEGEVAFRRYQLLSARDAYERAISVDSAFALAHLRLAEVAQWGATQSDERQTLHMAAAARHLDRLPERSAIRVRAARAEGIEQQRLLRQGVDRYPDDATLWYDLGEALIHGSDGFPRLEQVEDAFERALELEPGRAATYPHAIHLAFTEREDPARVRQLVEDFVSVAADAQGSYTEDADPRLAPWAYSLVFGSAAERAAARAAIDTLPPGFLLGASRYVFGPRRWDAFESIQLAAGRHSEADDVGGLYGTVRSTAHRHLLIAYALWRGQPDRALEFVADASLRPGLAESSSRSLLYLLHSAGSPLPDSLLNAEFGPARIGQDAPTETVLAAGAHAVAGGHRERVATAVAELERRDSTSVEAELLTAYAAWKEGDVDAAIPVFERHHSGRRLVQWWLGDAYVEAGRFSDAARVFESYGWNEWYQPFSPEPVARLKLGRVYEALDRPADARAAYAYFVEHWEEAESSLQPLVVEARGRIAALLEADG